MQKNNQGESKDELSKKLLSLAKQTYDARYESKTQLASLFAYTADLSGFNEEYIDAQIEKRINNLNSKLAEKDGWQKRKSNDLKNNPVESKKINDALSEIDRIEKAHGSFNGFKIRPKDERKWHLDTTIEPGKGSMLVCDSNATPKDIVEAHKFLNIVLCPTTWWKLSEIDETKISQKNPLGDLKVLGAYDIKSPDGTLLKSGNAAVDTIPIVMMPDGTYKVLTITRLSGERALNGGMNEGLAENKSATSIAEFLEEVISGSLFNKDFDNNTIASSSFNNLTEKEQTDLIIKCLGGSNTSDELIHIFLKKDIDLNEKFAQLATKRDELKTSSNLSDFDFDHLIVSLKISLYKSLCEKQYTQLKGSLLELIQKSKITFEETVMRSDPRSTNSSSVTTSPFVFVINQDNLSKILKEAGVGLVAGDDATDTKVCKLSDMVAGNIFADHPSIVMKGLAQAIDKKEIEINDDLLEQIGAMETCVNTRDQYLKANIYAQINKMHLDMRNRQTNKEELKAFYDLLRDAQSATLPLAAMKEKLTNMQANVLFMPFIDMPDKKNIPGYLDSSMLRDEENKKISNQVVNKQEDKKMSDLRVNDDGKLEIKDHEENCLKRKITNIEFNNFLFESGMASILNDPNALLVIVDMQLDFICGSLQVAGAYDTLDLIERIQREFGQERVYYTADNHPKDSVTFASNHDGMKPFTPFEFTGKNSKKEAVTVDRVGWPDHCVRDSKGQEIAISVLDSSHVVDKGTLKETECYSGCVDDMGNKPKFKDGRTLSDVCNGKNIVTLGLAKDFCVGNTAIDLKNSGAKSVTIFDNCTKSVCLNNSDKIMDKRLSDAGVIVKEAIQINFKSTRLSNTNKIKT
jgi:nicotinamidase/pyrazinamidase